MPIINIPPPPQQLIIRRLPRNHLPGQIPRLLPPNKMHQTNRVPVVVESRQILIIRTGRAVIPEPQSMPTTTIATTKMNIQQTLIRPIKTNPPLRQRAQRSVIPQIRPQHHHPAIKAIGPADVWRRGEGHVIVVVEGEEFVGSPKRDDVAVDVHDAAELGLAPEFDFGECGD